MRLSCKTLVSIAEPILFFDVTVVPCMGSFSEILELSQHPSLEQHVRRVTYDGRWSGFVTGVTPYISAAKDEFNDLKQRRLLQLVQPLQIQLDPQVERACLKELFGSLPSLTQVYINEAPVDNFDIESIPTYYRRVLRNMTLDYRNILHSDNFDHEISSSRRLDNSEAVLRAGYLARREFTLVDVGIRCLGKLFDEHVTRF